MGLDQFNVAPDNKGGRKPEREDDKFSPRGDSSSPYVSEEDNGEDWWRQKAQEALGHNMPTQGSISELEEHIMDISDYIHATPILVWKKLDHHDITEVNWEEYRDHYPEHTLDDRVPGYGGDVLGGSSSLFRSDQGRSGLSEDSGLAAAIDNAK